MTEPPDVLSAADAFWWVDDCIGMMEADLQKDVKSGLRNSFGTVSMSTAFSGVGAPEHA